MLIVRLLMRVVRFQLGLREIAAACRRGPSLADCRHREWGEAYQAVTELWRDNERLQQTVEWQRKVMLEALRHVDAGEIREMMALLSRASQDA